VLASAHGRSIPGFHASTRTVCRAGARDGRTADAIPNGCSDRPVDAAVALAIEQKWLVRSGERPHTIRLTDEGRHLTIINGYGC
jgi:hypothetical protein